MQYIYITERENTEIVLYNTFHERNGSYLEREHDPDKFITLGYIDNCSPTGFSTLDSIKDFMRDLQIIILEAKKNKDIEMENHLKEIFVLCKFCLWNGGKYILGISPFGMSKFPEELPLEFRFNMSSLG